MRHIRSVVAAVLALAVVVSCKKKEEAPPPPAVEAPAPPPAAAVTAIELGRHIGANKRVTDTTSVFARRDTLYLAVVTEHTPAGAQLSTRWTFQTGQVVDSNAQAVAAPEANSPVSVTEFHLVKPSGWPAGKYKVEVLLDGASKGIRDFEVKK